MPKPKITIETISKHTGLSRGTISRAINDRADINEGTKKRVLEACRKLKYIPSFAARTLATGRHYAIAVVVHSLHDPYVCGCVRGAMRAARESGYAIILHEALAADALATLQSVIAERTDATLLAAPLPSTLHQPILDAAGKRPLAACGFQLPSADLLLPDEAESGRMAVRKLIGAARRELLLLIDARQTDGGAVQRRAGMEEAAIAAGLHPKSIVELWSPAAAGESLAERLRTVNGVAATSDAAAVAAMLHLARMGRRVPQDVWVVGQGADPIGLAVQPTLSTTDLSGEECGYRAASTLIQRVGQLRADLPQRTTVAPVWIERQSTAGA